MPFQLHGMTDSTFYLQPLYNLFNLNTFKISIYGEINNFLADHFNPFLLVLFPLASIFNPIVFLNFLIVVSYSTFFTIVYTFMSKKINIVMFSMLLFSIPVLFFNFYLNFNGFHPVVLAPIFLIISYNYLFVEENANKSLLWFMPLLLIKEEFWLLLVFLSFSLFIRFNKIKYIFLTVVSAVLFISIYKLMSILYSENAAGIHSGHYAYIFDAANFKDLLDSIFNLAHWDRRILFIVLFFFPFLMLIDLKKIVLKDWITLVLIIGPTFGYCILSRQIPMTYWLFEHYALPVLPVVLIIVKKYGTFTNKRLLLFFFINTSLIASVISLKQPWQYKYYQDEKQLQEQVIPKLDLNFKDFLLVEDRTGVYFSEYQVDYVQYLNFMNNKNKIAKYVIFNTRYSYLANNIKYNTTTNKKASYDYILNIMKDLNSYEIIYAKYPFVIYKHNSVSKIQISATLLDQWDKKTIKSNKW